MQRFTELGKMEYGAGSAVALGYFDGVHLGHRAVLSEAVSCARSRGLTAAAFTFSLPVSGGFKGRRILTGEEKRRRIASLGVELYLCPPFEQFRVLSPRQFVDEVLQRDLGARVVFCGDNFTFGKDKAGNVEVLRRLCAERSIEVHVVPMAQYQGQTVSSTRIRACLSQGEMESVNDMLGQPYSLRRSVQRGQGLGHTLGFPTINLTYPEGLLIPRSGVYVTQVTLSDGTRHPGATGLGSRPTVSDEDKITCETFLPGFSGDIYGDEVTVSFYKYLWPTEKFESVNDLAAMVRRAARASLDYFQKQSL